MVVTSESISFNNIENRTQTTEQKNTSDIIKEEDVVNRQILNQYLTQKTNSHERLYHYTTLDSLIKIIEKRVFMLTRVDLLNDKAEKKLCQFDENTVDYVMGFTNKNEYISMWAMYGRPSGIKIRLDFKKDLLKCNTNNLVLNAISQNPIFEKKEKEFNIIELIKKAFKLKLSDVVYSDKNLKTMYHGDRTFTHYEPTENDIKELKGFIKYEAWRFENEIRLRARISLKDLDDNLTKKFPEHIFLKIDEALINDLHITYNPCMSSEMKKMVKKSLDGLVPGGLHYNSSQYDGEIADYVLNDH